MQSTFLQLILGVCIFYVFNAIEGQSSMLEVSRTKSDSIDQMVLGKFQA